VINRRCVAVFASQLAHACGANITIWIVKEVIVSLTRNVAKSEERTRVTAVSMNGWNSKYSCLGCFQCCCGFRSATAMLLLFVPRLCFCCCGLFFFCFHCSLFVFFLVSLPFRFCCSLLLRLCLRNRLLCFCHLLCYFKLMCHRSLLCCRFDMFFFFSWKLCLLLPPIHSVPLILLNDPLGAFAGMASVCFSKLFLCFFSASCET